VIFVKAKIKKMVIFSITDRKLEAEKE